MNSPSPLLLKYLQEGLIPTGKALVPGCGRGYDVSALAASDRFVVGLEISPSAIEVATTRLASLSLDDYPNKGNASFELKSFFDVNPQTDEERFDFVYDYTFLCALHPSIREDWARQMARIVKPEGILLTLIFPINPNKTDGPPFAVSLELLRSLLESVGFDCLELEMLPSELCHPGRDGSDGAPHGASGVGRWRRRSDCL